MNLRIEDLQRDERPGRDQARFSPVLLHLQKIPPLVGLSYQHQSTAARITGAARPMESNTRAMRVIESLAAWKGAGGN